MAALRTLAVRSLLTGLALAETSLAPRAEAAALSDETESWQVTGQRNAETVKTLFAIVKEVQGLQMTPAVMGKLLSQMLSFYAPKVSCTVARGSPVGFALADVPVTTCAAAEKRIFGNRKLLAFNVSSVAIDAASGGRTVLAFEPYDAIGVTNIGEEVPDSRVHGVVAWRYDFDAAGRIASYDEEVDSGIILDMMQKVARYERAHANSTSLSRLGEEGSLASLRRESWPIVCGVFFLLASFAVRAILRRRGSSAGQAPLLCEAA